MTLRGYTFTHKKNMKGLNTNMRSCYRAFVNQTRLPILFLLGGVILSGSKPSASDPVLLFKKVSDRLSGLKSVSYRAFRELRYPDENYHHRDSGKMYIDFDKTHEVGFTYQQTDSRGFNTFNNSELFNGNLSSKTLRVVHRVKLANLEGNAPLHNSIITLRNILPLVIKDDSIDKEAGDTLINGRTYYLLTFKLKNKLLKYTGTGFSLTTQPFIFTYKMIADKTSNLPVTLLQTRNGSRDLIRNDYLDLNTRPKAPVPKSWYYSTFLKEYTIVDDKPLNIIAAGQTAPDWQLTNYKTGAAENLAQYKGTLVLMEFWIRHCGYCIQAVDILNQLHDKYKDNDFEILAINTEASRENIRQFDSKNPMKYVVMYGDKPEVNKSYGIVAFPQVVLVGKDGNVIYSGGIDINKLEELIEKYK